MNTIKENLLHSLQTGFLDYAYQSEPVYRPRLLKNDYANNEKVLSTLLDELQTCNTFYFTVAFITSSGLATLLSTFKELYRQNISGKILTSNYLSFTDPRALEKILQFPNIELRIFEKSNFHLKGYLFEQSNYRSLIIGSSNLTQDALSKNMEWNLRVISTLEGELIRKTKEEFDKLWNKSIPLTPNSDWLAAYIKVYNEKKGIRTLNAHELPEVVEEEKEIIPNLMQNEAMQSLISLREKGENKALIISATGTGKTYLAAFDVKQFRPKKFLFVVHRELIARKSELGFKDILGEKIKTSFLIGSQKDLSADYIFAMIQTLSKDEVLYSIERDTFDYIVIDEVHRTGAATYQKILNYFKPKFLLGLTATPERTDGFNIYSLFDYNVAYEIRLHKALEHEMLCPFHYYGISEITVDGKEIDELSDFSRLVGEERINHIIENILLYKNNSEPIQGLMFCSSIKEAKELSLQLNRRGFKTISLTGADPEREREKAIVKLESKEIEYIISVDLFNEGIDIPCLNQIVMLRPTQSAIIFVQQLGRGLRKFRNKKYVTVIDFIANYANNYMVPIALYGDSSYNKDNLRKLLKSGSAFIPGASTVNFDFIAKEKIFKSINETSFKTLRLLQEEFFKLKQRLGKTPRLIDFINNNSIDPMIFLEKYHSYPIFLQKVEKGFQIKLSLKHLQSLRFISNEISIGLRPHELVLLQLLVEKKELSYFDFENILREKWQIGLDKSSFESVLRILQNQFFVEANRKKFGEITYVCYDKEKQILSINDSFASLLDSSEYKNHVGQSLELGISNYINRSKSGPNIGGLFLYSKYSRKDICKTLNWEKDESSILYGYKIQNKTDPWVCPIFVTYEKGSSIEDSIRYDDVFIDEGAFSWMTRNNVRINSKETVLIMDYEKNKMRIPFFIKKSDGEGQDHYYLGDVYPKSAEEQTISAKGKKLPVVNIILAFKSRIRQDIYNYFENPFS